MRYRRASGELFGARLCAGSIDAILQRTAAALRCPTRSCCSRPAPRRRSISMRPVGAPRVASAPSGRAHPGTAVFRIAPDRHEREARYCSASASQASPAQIAGGPTTTSMCNGANSVGLTWHATSPPMPRGSAPRGSSARPACNSPSASSPPGWLPADGDRTRLAERIAPLKRRSGACWRKRRAKALATVTTTPSPRTCSSAGRPCGPSPACPAWSHQQPCRARVARVGHLPQALARQPVRGGERAIERLLSASISCRLQKRSLFAYLSESSRPASEAISSPHSSDPAPTN